MPGGLETYLSPSLHTLDDGSTYILFGHGGETVPGNVLQSFAVNSDYDYIMFSDSWRRSTALY